MARVKATAKRLKRPSVLTKFRAGLSPKALEELRDWFNRTYDGSLPISRADWAWFYRTIHGDGAPETKKVVRRRVAAKIRMHNPTTRNYFANFVRPMSGSWGKPVASQQLCCSEDAALAEHGVFNEQPPKEHAWHYDVRVAERATLEAEEKYRNSANEYRTAHASQYVDLANE